MTEHKCNICEKHEDMDAVSCCVCNFRGDCGNSLCPLTNSSHEKALVRVVGKWAVPPNATIKQMKNPRDHFSSKDFIQVLCACGHIISENELKYE